MEPPKIDEQYETTTFLGEIASYLTYSSLTNARPEKNFLSNTQLYVGRYINKKTPYKGLLLYHGLGSGKTRASLSACTSFLETTKGTKDENKIVVMTPASLKPNFIKELQLLELYKSFIQIKEVSNMKRFFEFLDEYLQISKADVPAKYKTEPTYKTYVRDNPLVLIRYELYLLIDPFLVSCGYKTKKEFGGNQQAFDENEHNVVLKNVKKFVKKYSTLSYDDSDNYDDYLTFDVLEKYKEQQMRKQKMRAADERTDFTFLSYNSSTNFVRSSEDMEKQAFDKLSLDNKVLIIDEAHNFVSIIVNSLDSEKEGQFKAKGFRGEQIYKKIMAAKNLRIIALTGTPLINSAFEITVLINLLARKEVFPLKEQEFNQTYFDRDGQFKARQKNHFQQKLLGFISFNAGSKEEERYPTHKTETVRIPMSRYQFGEYMNQREVEQKSERLSRQNPNLVSVRLVTREVCDFAFPDNIDPEEDDDWLEKMEKGEYLTEEKLKGFSPKMHAIVGKIQKLNGKGKAIIYSFFVSKNGIAILEKLLELRGITYLTWNKDQSDEILGKFNSAETNLRGENYQVLLISKSGAEGISTKHVRQVHILEPWWHEALMLQITGRAIRLDSHADLPVAERNVEIYRYEAVFTEKQKTTAEKKINETLTTDEYVSSIAKRKLGEIQQVEQMMKQAAIDCLLYNPLGKEGCFYIKKPRGTGNFSVSQLKIQMTTIEIFNAENVKIPGSFTYSRERDKKEMTIYSFLEPICMFDIKLTAAPENHVWLYKKADSCRNTLIFPLDSYYLDTKTKPFQLRHNILAIKKNAVAVPSRKRPRTKTPSPTPPSPTPPPAKRRKTTSVQPFNPNNSKPARRKETTPIIVSDDEVSNYNVVPPPPPPTPSQFCKSLHIYSYKNNSCYVDSVLFSLFALPSKWVSDIMTQIRNGTYLERYSDELMRRANVITSLGYIPKQERDIKDLKEYLGRIYRMMLSIYDQYQNAGQCGLYENLRKIKLLTSPLEVFAKKPVYPFQNIGQQDANELLVIIFSHFRHPDLPKVSQQRITTYVKTPKMLELMPPQKKASKSVQTKSNLIYDTIYIQLVQSDDIVNFQGQIFSFSEMSDRERQDKEYYNPFDKPALHRLKGQEQQNVFKENFDDYFDKFNQVDTYSVDDSQSLLIVRLERNFNNRKLQKNFLIEKELFGLQLKKIIVHEGDEEAQGGHYVVYFECGKKWYKYDDNAKSKAIEEYGNFNAIAQLAETEEEVRNNVSTNCTTLFYQRS